MTANEQQKRDATYGPINNEFLKDPPTGESLTRWKYRRYMEDYLACIKSGDDNVGRLLDYLEESGLDKNTLVCYTSDQSFICVSTAGLASVLGRKNLSELHFWYNGRGKLNLLL